MKPLLFVVGDSISMQYGPYLEQFVAPRFRYARKSGREGNLDAPAGGDAANGGDSGMVLTYLKLLSEKNFYADAMLVNCGLHDIKRAAPAGRLQVEPQQYRENLEDIVRQWKELASLPVWIRTTPVDDAVHAARCSAFARHADDVAMVNQIADEVMVRNGIPRIDLHSFTAAQESPFCDHVHFSERVRALQAAFIAGAVEQLWSARD